MNHRDAAAIIATTAPGWAGPRARRLVQAVALHETVYGQGWSSSCPEMAGAHNWGAIQGSPGFVCTDHHADGTAYQARYRAYATDKDGARALWYQLERRPLVVRVLQDDGLDARGLAAALRATGYHESPISRYAAALSRALDALARAA